MAKNNVKGTTTKRVSVAIGKFNKSQRLVNYQRFVNWNHNEKHDYLQEIMLRISPEEILSLFKGQWLLSTEVIKTIWKDFDIQWEEDDEVLTKTTFKQKTTVNSTTMNVDKVVFEKEDVTKSNKVKYVKKITFEDFINMTSSERKKFIVSLEETMMTETMKARTVEVSPNQYKILKNIFIEGVFPKNGDTNNPFYKYRMDSKYNFVERQNKLIECLSKVNGNLDKFAEKYMGGEYTAAATRLLLNQYGLYQKVNKLIIENEDEILQRIKEQKAKAKIKAENKATIASASKKSSTKNTKVFVEPEIEELKLNTVEPVTAAEPAPAKKQDDQMILKQASDLIKSECLKLIENEDIYPHGISIMSINDIALKLNVLPTKAFKIIKMMCAPENNEWFKEKKILLKNSDGVLFGKRNNIFSKNSKVVIVYTKNTNRPNENGDISNELDNIKQYEEEEADKEKITGSFKLNLDVDYSELVENKSVVLNKIKYIQSVFGEENVININIIK